MIIGFGDNEDKRIKEEAKVILDIVKCEFDAYKGDCFVFYNDVIERIKENVHKRRDSVYELSKEYKKMSRHEAPERYSYYWVSVLSSASTIVFILKFHHINRDHALSPDGWALFSRESVITIGTDMECIVYINGCVIN